MTITAVALTVGGTIVGRLTGRPRGPAPARLGGVAVLVTYGIGRLIGNPVS